MARQPPRAVPRRTRARQTQRQRIDALSRPERAAYQRTLTAIKRMRRGVPLTLAAADAGTTTETVRKYAPSVVRRASNGRYRATKADRLYRAVQMQTMTGSVTVHTTNSGTASLIARHHAAIRRILADGEDSALQEFKRLRIRDGTHEYRFLTNNTLIEELSNAGELDFEGFYHAPR